MAESCRRLYSFIIITIYTSVTPAYTLPYTVQSPCTKPMSLIIRWGVLFSQIAETGGHLPVRELSNISRYIFDSRCPSYRAISHTLPSLSPSGPPYYILLLLLFYIIPYIIFLWLLLLYMMLESDEEALRRIRYPPTISYILPTYTTILYHNLNSIPFPTLNRSQLTLWSPPDGADLLSCWF